MAVSWEVNGTPGGSLSLGAISASGLYSAPDPLPAASVTISAVSVQTPTVSGNTTVSLAYPLPTISGASPSMIVAGASGVAISISGAGFVHESSVSFGGVSVPTSFTSATSVQATIPATLLASVGTTSLTISNPTPGGGAVSLAGGIVLQPGIGVAMPVPSILVPGSQAVAIAAYVAGANVSTSVQLFDLTTGTPILVGTMLDDGKNGDPVAGDKVYELSASLTPPAANSMNLEVVATAAGQNGVAKTFTIPVATVPGLTSDAQANQMAANLYATAIQTRSALSAASPPTSATMSTVVSNLIAMYGEGMAIAAQAQTDTTSGNTDFVRSPKPAGVLSALESFLTPGLVTAAANGQACGQLITSLEGTGPLALNDPQLDAFAQELVNLNLDSADFSLQDYLGGNLAAAIAAQEYLETGAALPTPIAGCGGAAIQAATSVGVEDDLGQFTDLAGSGIADAGDLGTLSSATLNTGTDYALAEYVDSQGTNHILIGQTNSNGALPSVPAGTYTAVYSSSGNTALATITNTPVYPSGTTDVPVVPGASSSATPPNIAGFSPTAGPPGATVTIAGSGFDINLANDNVQFDGIVATVLSVSALGTTLNATVPSGATSAPIQISTTQGISTSASSFIVQTPNPTPTISGLSPSSAVAGSAPITLTIIGTGFIASSVVTFNGTPRLNTIADTEHLTIPLNSSDLATAGSYSVTVTNPAPGGGAALASFVVTSGGSSGAAQGEWLWVGGSDQISAPAVYGNEGQTSPANSPGARDSGVSWVDTNGNLWLFGGANALLGYLDDLWKYSPSTKEWTWVSGSNLFNPRGVYGTQGQASSANIPGGRVNATSWIDASGNLWLFGGSGLNVDGHVVYLNDLWEYVPASNTWTWVGGSDEGDTQGVYGTQGQASPTNMPGGRANAFSWIDASGNLWLFGGSGIGATNDLWKYTPSIKEWTWVGGGATAPLGGNYGTKGQASSANIPGARWGGVSWIDTSGHFWLFGGYGYISSIESSYLNDLWEYSPATNEWTWANGTDQVNQLGIYGTLGQAALTNSPGARTSALSWIDPEGNLWLFGGYSYVAIQTIDPINDLWKYTPSTNEWTWIGGSAQGNAPGVYGALVQSAQTSSPGARDYALSWVDASGNLWLFGGYGIDSTGASGDMNDLWEYTPGTTMPGSNLRRSSEMGSPH